MSQMWHVFRGNPHSGHVFWLGSAIADDACEASAHVAHHKKGKEEFQAGKEVVVWAVPACEFLPVHAKFSEPQPELEVNEMTVEEAIAHG